jgi:hypothetical protein
MKNFAILAVGAIVIGGWMFAVSASEPEDQKQARGGFFFSDDDCEGAAATINGSEGRLAWDGSETVTVAVPAKIRWSRGHGTDVVLKGDKDDLERIRLYKGTLQVCGDMDDIDDEIEIVLPGRTVREVTIAGAGELTMDGVDQPSLDLTIAGAGKMEASGTSDDLKLTIAGAGDARLGKLATKRLDLTITGAGSAEASPADDADVTIVGAGDVDLLTRPARHDFDVFGAGDIKMPDEI